MPWPAGRHALATIDTLGARWDDTRTLWQLPFRPERDATLEHIRRLADEIDQLNVPDDVPGRLLELAATDLDADHARRCALAVMRHHGDDARVLAYAETQRDAADVALRLAADHLDVIRRGLDGR